MSLAGTLWCGSLMRIIIQGEEELLIPWERLQSKSRYELVCEELLEMILI